MHTMACTLHVQLSMHLTCKIVYTTDLYSYYTYTVATAMHYVMHNWAGKPGSMYVCG